jgi:AcrR family transcriptional regulator
MGGMAAGRQAGPRRKPADQYHHGALREALLQAALRTIQRHGVEALTLRAVGEGLGVSRTALYRHFADKSALLEAVAREGFRLLREALVAAYEKAGRGRAGFEAMGEAYVSFAVTNPSHYRVMFGSALGGPAADPELAREGAAAFQVLVDAIVEQQRAGTVAGDDPLQLARFIWALVHGIAMLTLDRRLPADAAAANALARFAIHRVRTGIATTV